MKAVVYERYGGPEVLALREVATPTPADHEVLIEVRATTVTSADARLRALRVPPGFGPMVRLAVGVRAPRRRVLGVEMSGVVAAVGRRVTRFAVGAPVFGIRGARVGCHAEYCVFPEDGALAAKPASVSFAEAAALCFGGTTALDFFRRADLQPGERVLVNGASGAVGTAAVQIAKHLGAHVTGVCGTANLALVRSLGADAVIDYTQEDFAGSGAVYDVIMDTAGTAPFARSRAALTPRGRLLVVLGGLPDMLGALWTNLTSRRTVVVAPAGERAEDVRRLAELAASGAYRPVIDRTYPLERIAEAHALVDGGHKRGNVVITVGRADQASAA